MTRVDTGLYYDKDKKELVGSDALFKCDGRKTIATAAAEARLRFKRQYEGHKKNPRVIKPRMRYIRFIKSGTIMNPVFLTGFIPLAVGV